MKHLLHLVGEYTGDAEEEASFATTMVPEDPPKQSTKPDVSVPWWCPDRTINARGCISIASDQYVARVLMDNILIEAIADTGGSRSLIDYDTARTLGLSVQKASAEKSCGSYYGPGGKLQKYYGIVEGPIAVQFDDQVVLKLQHLKVVRHPEPLLLFGADLLCAGR